VTISPLSLGASTCGSPLIFGIHAGTIQDLPITSAVGGMTWRERHLAARDAGFALIQDGDDDLALAAGLERAGMGRVVSSGEASQLAKEGSARGLSSITLHVGTGFENDDEADVLVVEILEASAAHGIPLYIETHRATITQDPWRTLRLIERHPSVSFTGEF
jgi:hypothetical protein